MFRHAALRSLKIENKLNKIILRTETRPRYFIRVPSRGRDCQGHGTGGRPIGFTSQVAFVCRRTCFTELLSAQPTLLV